LEVHHKKQLSEGGEDTVENAIALCPNCHREAHYGDLKF
jgi:5-methylcytosine-specific restriction protein A